MLNKIFVSLQIEFICCDNVHISMLKCSLGNTKIDESKNFDEKWCKMFSLFATACFKIRRHLQIPNTGTLIDVMNYASD